MKNIKKHVAFACFFLLTHAVHAGSFEDFFKAAAIDNESAMVTLALRGFDLNTRNEKGESGLMVALREDSLKVAAFLLTQRSVNVNDRNANGETALMIAAIRGQLDIARALIQRGAEVNMTGWTPLHYAASRAEPDSVEMVKLMLEHHAYIDTESPNRSTPLMLAAMYGNRELVPLLLAEGADPTIRNEQGLTAVDFARRADRDDLAERIAQVIRQRAPAAR